MKNILILGGDSRNLELANILKKDYKVETYGFNKQENLNEKIKQADAIITAIPITKDGKNVILEFKEKLTIEELINLCENKKIITGKISLENKQKLEQKNNNVIDILKLEEYAILNAQPTAEGAVQLAMENTKKVLKGSGKKVALLDLGAKNNIAKSLNARGCEVTIYPAHTSAEEILATNPDGIMLSNGPGDPKECTEIIAEIKKLYDSNVPIFAICLGHQLMALATGADTHKMKYGHRGGNHPVKDLATNRVYISSQNHGYVVDTDTLDPAVAKPAFVNVNDGTNEGLEYIGKNIFTVQFHPEACPGPQDSAYLFDRFIEMMEQSTL